MEQIYSSKSREILAASRLGTLALAKDGCSYAIPMFFGFDGNHVYFHGHPGLKDEYMDATEEACFVVSHVGSANIWESVHVFGPIEKLTLSSDIDAAKNALFNVPPPPAEGNFPKGLPKRTDHSVYYARINSTKVCGKVSEFKKEST